MRDQEMFDTVVEHLRQQGRPSVDSGGNCAYRGQDGCKCAAGIFIPDLDYDPDMESRNLYDLSVNFGLFDDTHWPTLNSLREAHDNSESPAQLNECLREIAEDYGLSEEFEPIQIWDASQNNNF